MDDWDEMVAESAEWRKQVVRWMIVLLFIAFLLALVSLAMAL